MRCLGTVLAAIAVTAGILLAGFFVVGALFWLTVVTANFFQLSAIWGGVVLLGYMVLIIGTVLGVVVCRESVIP